MTWAYVINSTDRRTFKRCRRAWDMGSHLRQNYEPVTPMQVFDFARAIADALAVYYFPGMWNWNREIVLPLAMEGFFLSMQRQRGRYERAQPVSAEAERMWTDHLNLGERMLSQYFEWAVGVDQFSPIRVETEFEVNIPDPIQPGQDLAVREGVPIRYRGRIHLLVVDQHDVYWLVKHQIVDAEWNDLNDLRLDEQGVSYCWAWENFYLGMKIAGTIYNELRKSPASGSDAAASRTPTRTVVQAGREPDQALIQEGNSFFRRTQIPRSRKELKNVGRQLALEAQDLANPEVRVYPNPSPENCSVCAYLRPCIMMNEGLNASAILETAYRERSDERIESRIGSTTWSVDRGAMPPYFGRRS